MFSVQRVNGVSLATPILIKHAFCPPRFKSPRSVTFLLLAYRKTVFQLPVLIKLLQSSLSLTLYIPFLSSNSAHICIHLAQFPDSIQSSSFPFANSTLFFYQRARPHPLLAPTKSRQFFCSFTIPAAGPQRKSIKVWGASRALLSVS